MIFTGVTGGEIVSLLYPLFILSPFCYIIISKESLDGPPRLHAGDGILRALGAAGDGKTAPIGPGGRVHGPLRGDDRIFPLHQAGGGHVSGVHGIRLGGENL